MVNSEFVLMYIDLSRYMTALMNLFQRLQYDHFGKKSLILCRGGISKQ